MSVAWDSVIVGGGAAGLNAALVLSRARRRVLVVDAGNQSNLASDRIGGVLGADGMAPAEFYARSRETIAAYGHAEFMSGTIASGTSNDGGFTLTTEDDEIRARTVLIATGMEYRFPDIPGLSERWGHSVFHCPFCHGWEVRGQVLGVLDSSEMALHRALLLRAWSADVTLFTNGPAGLSPDELEQLSAVGIDLDERSVAAAAGPDDDTLESIQFTDGTEKSVTGLLVESSMHQRSDLVRTLGGPELITTQMTTDGVKVDQRTLTSVPGLFAAGDVTGAMPTLPGAMAAGGMAGSAIVGELTEPAA